MINVTYLPDAGKTPDFVDYIQLIVETEIARTREADAAHEEIFGDLPTEAFALLIQMLEMHWLPNRPGLNTHSHGGTLVARLVKLGGEACPLDKA